MSRAVELAKECGAQESMYLVALGDGMYAMKMTPEQLEAFYHAARAEMAREAVEFCHQVGQQPSSLWQEPGCWTHSAECCAAGLRAMADREGK